MQLLPRAASVTGTAAGLAELVERPAAGDAWKSGGATAACGNCSRLRIPGGLGDDDVLSLARAHASKTRHLVRYRASPPPAIEIFAADAPVAGAPGRSQHSLGPRGRRQSR